MDGNQQAIEKKSNLKIRLCFSPFLLRALEAEAEYSFLPGVNFFHFNLQSDAIKMREGALPQVAGSFIAISSASHHFLSLLNPLFLKSPAQSLNVINTFRCLHQLSFRTICCSNLKSSNAWGSRPLSLRKLKNNRAKLFNVGFFFPPSALLHPRVDIFLAFQL